MLQTQAVFLVYFVRGNESITINHLGWFRGRSTRTLLLSVLHLTRRHAHIRPYPHVHRITTDRTLHRNGRHATAAAESRTPRHATASSTASVCMPTVGPSATSDLSRRAARYGSRCVSCSASCTRASAGRRPRWLYNPGSCTYRLQNAARYDRHTHRRKMSREMWHAITLSGKQKRLKLCFGTPSQKKLRGLFLAPAA